MQITTVHTLTFTMKAAGNEQHNAAIAIVKGGATTVGVTINIAAMPLLDTDDNITRSTAVQAQSSDEGKCEIYWVEVQRALAFIGVETSSP